MHFFGLFFLQLWKCTVKKINGNISAKKTYFLNLLRVKGKGKNKAIPEQALGIPGGWGSQILWQSAHEGGEVFSSNHRPPLPPRKYIWFPFLLEAESNPGPYAAGMIMSMWMKNFNDIMGNQTRDHPACNAVPQPTTPPRATKSIKSWTLNFLLVLNI